jgi:hypothetical protein
MLSFYKFNYSDYFHNYAAALSLLETVALLLQYFLSCMKVCRQSMLLKRNKY